MKNLNTEFLKASEEGNLNIVIELIDSGADINSVDSRGRNCLLFAAFSDNFELIKYLTEIQKLPVNSIDHYSNSPLIISASKGCNLKIIKYLVENGANTNLENNMAKNALTFAAEKNNLEVIKFLIEKGSKVADKTNRGVIPLIYSIKNNNFELVKILVENGAEINKTDEDGKTPLMYAAWEENFQIIKYLYENGADLNLKDKFRNETVLMKNASVGAFEVVKFLIEDLNADFNTLDNEGNNILMAASDLDANLEVVNYLLTKQFNINYQNIDGYTALLIAAKEDSLEIAKCLVKNGADINLKTNSDISTVMFFAKNGNFEMVKFLVEKGAFLNETDGLENSVLNYAEESGNLELMNYLTKLLN
ncbi:MAG: ankyrin repeat domain-containing protein [Candidatus Sericytochromatia bacterium]